MALLHSPSTITNGLIFHVDASNPRSYPGNGTTWYDLSGNGNHGTLTNMSVPACYVRTYGGKALNFDGVNDYISVANSTALQQIGQTTISFWCKLVDNSAVSPLVSKVDANAGVGEYELFADLRSGARTLAWRPGAGGTFVSFFNGFMESWALVTVSVNGSAIGSKINAYRNGVLFGTTSTVNARTTSTYPLSLGWRSGNSFYASTQIDDIRIYNRALTQQEILQNYNALRGRFGV